LPCLIDTAIASNVGALIGPNLVRRDDNVDTQELFKETSSLNALVETLIVQHSGLFTRICTPRQEQQQVNDQDASSPTGEVQAKEQTEEAECPVADGHSEDQKTEGAKTDTQLEAGGSSDEAEQAVRETQTEHVSDSVMVADGSGEASEEHSKKPAKHHKKAKKQVSTWDHDRVKQKKDKKMKLPDPKMGLQLRMTASDDMSTRHSKEFSMEIEPGMLLNYERDLAPPASSLQHSQVSRAAAAAAAAAAASSGKTEQTELSDDRKERSEVEEWRQQFEEAEITRIAILTREKEVEEVRKISRVKFIKEMKEKEIQGIAEREAWERDLKHQRDKRKSTVLIASETVQAKPLPPDTEHALKERRAQNTREFFEKKITEGKIKSKEEIEAEVRQQPKKSSLVLSSQATKEKIATKLALFESPS